MLAASERRAEQRYLKEVRRLRSITVTKREADRVDFATSRVNLCFTMGDETGGELRWAVWDRNLDGDQMGLVWIGPLHQEGDSLDKPPGEAYWALRDAQARAAIRAMR